ncbi:oxidoreductase [Patescibacteria group bacterium]|nr:oxidoreductase [Patescibacteria group bacterium]
MWNKLIKKIDYLLNGITMYRLVLYYLIFLVGIGIIFSAFKVLPYNPFNLAVSVIFITAVCFLTNILFSKVFKAQTNVESVYITALILSLIITPFSGQNLLSYISISFWASVWAMASKYILAIKKKHIFNPAAFGVALTGLLLGESATWWIGNPYMMPFVLLGGLIMTRKILRSDLVWGFVSVSLITIMSFSFSGGSGIFTVIWKALAESPLLFFAFVMLTEPLTTPPSENLRIVYGALTGFLFAPQVHLGSFYLTPELALIISNVFSYAVSSKKKLVLTLDEKTKTGPDTYDFIFKPGEKIKFSPGQYLEWTLGHKKPDSRGNRRYFTIASSPTEKSMRIGVKFYPRSSTFKKSLLAMKEGDEIVASGLSGDFILPKSKRKKMVFLAGGIGITPMRSMTKYLLDINERRDIIIFYSNRTPEEIMYADVFEESRKKLGIKTFYTLTGDIPEDWGGETGRIDEKMIKRLVPDYLERFFYVSGTNSMVKSMKEMLKDMGVKKKQVITDFFPGF